MTSSTADTKWNAELTQRCQRALKAGWVGLTGVLFVTGFITLQSNSPLWIVPETAFFFLVILIWMTRNRHLEMKCGQACPVRTLRTVSLMAIVGTGSLLLTALDTFRTNTPHTVLGGVMVGALLLLWGVAILFERRLHNHRTALLISTKHPTQENTWNLKTTDEDRILVVNTAKLPRPWRHWLDTTEVKMTAEELDVLLCHHLHTSGSRHSTLKFNGQHSHDMWIQTTHTTNTLGNFGQTTQTFGGFGMSCENALQTLIDKGLVSVKVYRHDEGVPHGESVQVASLTRNDPLPEDSAHRRLLEKRVIQRWLRSTETR